MPAHEPRTTTQDPKRIGLRARFEHQRERREAKGGQPWLVRKLTVGIVVGIVGYTVYVYVATLCVPMIKGNSKAIGGRTTGIAFLVVFSLLFLMLGWTYAKVVFTSPGYARDYVAQTPPPVPGSHPESRPGPWESDDSLMGSPYDNTTPVSRSHSRPSVNNPSISNSQRSPHSPHPSRSPPHTRRNTHDSAVGMSQIRPAATSQRSGEIEVSPLDGVSPMASSRTAAVDSIRGQHDHRTPPPAHLRGTGTGNCRDNGLPFHNRRPPTHPALLPEYRYCFRDGLVKPMRAHHCRSCGTCILKYDHHCPWIGQCVGAFNHKFFVNFLQWSAVFSVFVFATLVLLNARASSDPSNINPQHIVLIVLSGIFTLFTCTLFITHVHLIILNASTVERMGMHRMRERERIMLSEMTSLPCPCSSRARDLPASPEVGGHSFRVLTSRRRIRKQWDAEWGEIGTEGNLWWLGSKRANWEATMGKKKWGWILPIGRSLGNGLTYPVNPRFDRDGRWRRRAEWPDGFR